MATLRDIKRKIGAVKKTQSITRAMNMVAAAKLRSTQVKMEKFKSYSEKYKEIINRLTKLAPIEEGYPLLQVREEIKKVHLVVIGADRGLCGAFNSNLITRVERFITDLKNRGQEVILTIIGKKPRDYFRKRDVNIKAEYVGVVGKIDYIMARRIATDVLSSFISGESDEVYVFFTKFVSMVKQEPTVERFLPIKAEVPAEGEVSIEYIYEPAPKIILEELLPKSLNITLYSHILESEVAEHAARMRAMENATNNCKEMINTLTLLFNKTRQAAITKELMDIVGGAEALRAK